MYIYYYNTTHSGMAWLPSEGKFTKTIVKVNDLTIKNSFESFSRSLVLVHSRQRFSRCLGGSCLTVNTTPWLTCTFAQTSTWKWPSLADVTWGHLTKMSHKIHKMSHRIIKYHTTYTRCHTILEDVTQDAQRSVRWNIEFTQENIGHSCPASPSNIQVSPLSKVP